MRFFLRFLTWLVLAACGWLIWTEIGLREWFSPRRSAALDPAFLRLGAAEIASLPLAVRFDHPLGTEHGGLTYNARGFRVARHLGADLNGIGGGNSDLGDPVFAVADGRVVYAGEPGEGWGRMLIVAHRLPDATDPRGHRIVQSVYAHLQDFAVPPGRDVRRGERLGSVGTAEGRYLAHLHFEIREGPYINPGQGYADTPLNRVDPETFLRAHRGADDAQLNAAPGL
jgi:murein DD-endopeptidase MepM/ murein hydrolase activator NlpD